MVNRRKRGEGKEGRRAKGRDGKEEGGGGQETLGRTPMGRP